MNISTPKKVSVAMTTYNGEVFLKKQLDSILSQSVKVNEIIICDDRSSDGTISILEEYSKLTNLKYYVNTETLGFVKNFEKALNLCINEYIVLADQDDIWYPQKIEVLLNSIGDNLLIHSDCDLINEKDEVILKNFKGKINTHHQVDDFLFNNVVTGCTTMIHRELLKNRIPFPEGIAYHDWYLAIHAAYQGKIAYNSQSLTGYRQHTNQDTGTGINESSSIIRNCWYRFTGKEFNNINSVQNQVRNLKASVYDFSHDEIFYNKHLDMIRILEEYINRFFHFSFGNFYAEKFVKKKESNLKRLFYRLKFSIG